MRPHPLRTALAVALVLLFSACGDSADPSSGVQDEGPLGTTFHFAQAVEPRTLDPGHVTDSYSGFIVQNLFEGLLVWDPAGKTLLPGMAESYEVSPDGKSYTFKLRKNAIWSNGDPVTAEDFVVAWRRVLNPDTGSEYAQMLYPLKGARALHQGELKDIRELGVEARDRFTLLVSLDRPAHYFPAVLAHHVTAPVHGETLKRYGYLWTRPENIVVNGPFLLEKWEPGKQLVLKKNPYYHSADEVRIDRVVVHIVTDPERVLAMYERGELHWTGHASSLPVERLAELAKRADAHSTSELGTAFYYLNTEVEPLGDRRVRRALSLAIDRESLRGLISPGGVPTQHLVPPGMPGYQPAAGLVGGPDQARALLAAAGYPGGEGFPPLELAIDKRPLHEGIARKVVAIWKEQLGIDVTIFPRDWRAHAEARENRDFQIARGGWLADYPDPATFLEILLSTNELNVTGWHNRGYDGLVAEGNETEDAASRMRMLAQAEQLAIEEMPIIPLFHFGNMSLLKQNVSGWIDNPLNLHLLRYIRVRAQPSMAAPKG